MTDRLDLPRRYRRIVEALLREHVPDAEVWAYGSRVNGESHEGSDLDLVVRGPDLKRIPSGPLAGLIEALEDSNVPILVQTHDWARLPESFHWEIERGYVVVQEGTNRTVAGKRRDVPFAQLLEEPVRNGIYKKREFHGRGVKVVNMGELFANPRLRAVDMKRVELTESEQRRFGVQAGDLLFARRSLVAEGAGKCSVVLEANEFTTFESSIIRARPDPTKADSLFLYYYFNSPIGLHALDTIRRHVAVAGITGTDLAQLAVEMPPLAEQRAIARILGTLDDKIELNRRMNATLEAMARALFKSWFVDFDPVRAKMEGRDTGLPPDVAALFPDRLVESELGEIPEGWEVVPLPEMIEVNPPRSLRKGEVAPYLDMANMPTRGHVPDTVIDRPFGSGMRFTNGDTLVARITPCLENGKTAYVDFLHHDRIGWGSTEYIVMRPKPPLPNEFAYCLARSTGFREFAIPNMTGTSGRQRVPAQALSQFLLPSPPEPLAARFGKVVQPLFARASEAVRDSRTFAVLRDALLPKLVSGKLRVAHKFHDPYI